MSTRLRLFLVAAAALVARAAVLARFADHPLLRPAGGLDTEVYVDLAGRIAGGDVLLRSVPGPFFVSPLYAWFLGLVFAVTDGSLLLAKVAQVVLGAAAVWLVGDSARRLFGDRAAVPAAALLGLTGVVAFHESILLQAALDPFLTALALWLLLGALEGEAVTRRFLGAGLALGVLALNRPNVLPWAAVAALLLVVARGVRAGLRPAGALVLGTVLAIAPATLRNAVVSGEPVAISSHGGLNLLIGNGPGAGGTYRWLDGITPSIKGQAADATRVAEAAAGRPLSAGEVSGYFARQAWAWIAAEPGAAARLFARKLRYVVSGDEVPLNFSTPWYRRQSVALRLLAVGPGLLVPLGGVGLALAGLGRGRLARRDALVWVSFAPCYAALVAAFFVATRYRLPLLVPLATAAGGAVVFLVDAVRARRTRALLLSGTLAAPLAALALWPTGLHDGAADEETEWILHLVDSGDADEATRRATALAVTHPEPGVLWFRLGQAWASAGQLDRAVDALSRSLSIDARQPETMRVLSAVHERRGLERALAGDPAGALPDLERAVALDVANASARLNLAAVLGERGDLTRARSLVREAIALRPGYAKAEALLRALAALPAK